MKDETSTNGFSSSLQQALDAMQRDWARLQMEIAELRTERDQFKKALLAVMFKDEEEFTLTKEEVFAIIAHQKPIEEFLQEMRTLVGD
jgi:predicted  nucleic acid-binding Zn-ribbon protein